MKSYTTIIFAFILALSGSAFAEVSIFEHTDSDGTRYDYTVSLKAIQASPSWVPPDRDPPLSIKEASNIALKWVSKNKEIPTTKMNVQSIYIYKIEGIQVPKNKWGYSISINVPYKNTSYVTASYTIVVLMDGTVVKPTVYKRTKNSSP